MDDQPQIVRDLLPFFKTIPASMFTAFRCFTGECTDHDGRTIHSILAEEFGPVFIFSYVASYMLVSMGIFNVRRGCVCWSTVRPLGFQGLGPSPTTLDRSRPDSDGQGLRKGFKSSSPSQIGPIGVAFSVSATPLHAASRILAVYVDITMKAAKAELRRDNT